MCVRLTKIILIHLLCQIDTNIELSLSLYYIFTLLLILWERQLTFFQFYLCLAQR